MAELRSGILVVDKPEGISSAAVVARVKRGLKAKKAGHCGTLDPFASGVIVCGINQATRISRFFLHGDKRYEGVLRLGVETDTQDRTGAVVSECPVNVTDDAVRTVFAAAVGPMRQQPPAFSALKHKGVPLYKLARAGRPVQKPARDIVIHHLEILAINLPDVHFDVACSGGTYIRTLAADLGRALECGAHLRKLVRTESGPFTLDQAIDLASLAAPDAPQTVAARMIGMNEALSFMPERTAGAGMVDRIRHGMPLTEKDLAPPATGSGSPWLRVVDPDRRLLAILEHKKGIARYNYCCVFN
jgi:tRNA pseudouridine55 synthase